MLTDDQMWIKLYNVLDSVQTEAQRKGAIQYLVLWYKAMALRLNDDTDTDQFLNAVFTLHNLKLS